jgi:hypothetical protein
MQLAAAAAVTGQHHPSDHPSTLPCYKTIGHATDFDPMKSNDHTLIARHDKSGSHTHDDDNVEAVTHESIATTQAVTRTTMTPSATTTQKSLATTQAVTHTATASTTIAIRNNRPPTMTPSRRHEWIDL